MNQDAAGHWLMPIHHSTFKLSDEPMEEPMQRLLAASAADQSRIVGRELGQLWTPTHTVTVSPQGIRTEG